MANNNTDQIEEIFIDIRRRWDSVNQVPPSMYRVPKTLRDVSKNCYTPRIVSIGPFHEKDEHLNVVDVHKISYMKALIDRLGVSLRDEYMKACIEKVHGKIVEIKACYEKEETEAYHDLKFVQMMVTDSCFILEMIYRSDQGISESRSFFDNNLLTLYVKHDFLLLENQVPFFVLADIFECTIRSFDSSASLAKLVLEFMKDMNPFGRNLLPDNYEDNTSHKHKHILGLLHTYYVHAHSIQSGTSTIPSNAHSIQSGTSSIPSNSAEEFSKTISYSITELALAGLKFKPNKDQNCRILEMEFISSRYPCFFWSWGKPTFRMPRLQVEDYTESVLRNLIAYEQSSSKIPNYVTSYAFAMERMLDTKEDIIKLIESKVVINNLGSSEQASNMINNICKEVTVKDFMYINQWKQLEIYCNSYWPKHIARLRSTHCSTPWNFIALVAALVLFGLTVAKTYYSIHQRK